MLLRKLFSTARSGGEDRPAPEQLEYVTGIFLSGGDVVIRVPESSDDSTFLLSVDGIPAAFEAITASEAEAILSPIARTLTFDHERPVDLSAVPIRPSTPKAKIGVSTNPDWAVVGCDTLQIALKASSMPLDLPVVGSLEIPPHEMPVLFSAGLAVHRGHGKLVVKVIGESHTETFDIPFDTAKHGGRRIESYQRVSIVLPACSEQTTLSMKISAGGAESNDAMDTYFFLVEPRVTPFLDDCEHESVVVVRDTAQVSNTKWLLASPLARVAVGSELKLIANDGAMSIMEASNCVIKLHEDRGHTIFLSASEAGRFGVFIDGKLAFSQFIGSEPTAIRIPKLYLTGAYRFISVWDISGLREFFGTYVHCPNTLTPKDVLQIEGKPPYPTALGDATAYRYLGLKSQLTVEVPDTVRLQASYCLEVLERGHKAVELKPLSFPEVQDPDVSIVLPVHNKIEVTYLALCSLLFAQNKTSFEVVLVDDASTDETSRIESIVSGLRVVRHEEPQRFIRACNHGAEQARGKYVVLLNNDVEVTTGWLDALVSAITSFDNVGLVGSRLIYPDGRLQDAGGLIWKTGNPWNYGHGLNPHEPRFCYARQVDYLSGAALMTTKKIWEEVGGFSNYLEPMYFEDTDLAFKVRQAGYNTWYVPSSTVYHYEGMTSGTDTSKGFKRFQDVNAPKFKRKWSKSFRDFGEEGVNPDLEKDRGVVGRVLFIDHGIPRPDRDAGGFAAIQEMRLVQSLGYKVTFLPQNLAHLGGYTEDLQKLGIEAIYAPFYLSVQEYLERHAADFDAFYITRYYVAEAVLPTLRRLVPQKKVIFNNADLHFLRELRSALADKNLAGIEAAKVTRQKEVEVMRDVDLVLSYTDVEHAVITSHTDGAASVAKCPWVVECPDVVGDIADRTGLSFLGSYRHYPNVQAVNWFVENVSPRLEIHGEKARFHIYGSGMTDEIKALSGDLVAATGFIENLADAYDKHRIFVAPLMSGAGIKGKVLNALAHGVPCVLTPIAAEGTGVRDGIDCIIARTLEDWENAITELLDDDDRWHQISQSSRQLIRDTYSFEEGKRRMSDAFEKVGLF